LHIVIVLRRLIAVALAGMAISACATSHAAAAGQDAADHGGSARPAAPATAGDRHHRSSKPADGVVADPFEPFNRAMFAFDDKLDRVILKPVSKAYVKVVPQFGRSRVRDFLDNWKSPVWLANDLLQGDLGAAGVTTSRFALNSTIGLAGFYDFAAAHAKLQGRDEDFGQTLGVYGVGNGPYLVLPGLGPTTVRDISGTAVDAVIDPFTWARFDGDLAYGLTTRAADVVDSRALAEPAIQAIQQSVDPYAQARALYIQNREDRVRNGVEKVEDLPNFD
jgi:phospholipid-binding lipoprotein MlaA